MKRLVMLALVLVHCAPTVLRGPGHGRVLSGRFHSEALGVEKSYWVWLPPGYDDGDARFPVVYLLHGLGGDETDWLRSGHADRAAERIGLRAILVMPDGDAGFWADRVETEADAKGRFEACRASAAWRHYQPAEDFCVRRARYETYVVGDLVSHIDGTFRTVRSATGRGIGGLSMGGFGALMLAMRHPDLFAAAASHSGVDSLLYEAPHPFVAHHAQLVADVRTWGGDTPIGALVRGVFGADRTNWEAHDPATLAARPGFVAPAIYLDCGDDDHYRLDDGQRHLDEILTAAGIPHEASIIPGRHDFSLWERRLEHSLRFFQQHLSR